MIIDYRKVKCDECGKDEIIEDGGSYPSGWFVIEVSEWYGNSGEGRLSKEVCSEKCVLELMNNLKKLPKKESMIY